MVIVKEYNNYILAVLPRINFRGVAGCAEGGEEIDNLALRSSFGLF